MLVRLISNLYYDTPKNTLGIIIKELGQRVDRSIDKPEKDYLYIVRFSNNEEEVVWKKDLQMIQRAYD